MDVVSTGKLLIGLGIGIAVLGGLFLLLGRSPLKFGNLPGDIRIEGQGFTCFAPLVSMCLLSILLTIIVNVVARLLAR